MADIFFIKSTLDCDSSRHCYIQDDNYDEFPITNCTTVLNSIELTGICYELVFDLGMALATMGGLLSFTRIELAILAAINVKIVNFLKGKRKHTVFWAIFQAILIFSVVIIIIVAFAYLNGRRKLTHLRLAGLYFNFLGIVVMVILSSLIPWCSLVNSNYAIMKVSIPKKNFLCIC